MLAIIQLQQVPPNNCEHVKGSQYQTRITTVSRLLHTTVSLSLLCFRFYLLFLPEFPIIFTHYSYFITMPSPNIPVIFSKFLVSVTMRSTVYLVAPK